MKFKLWLLQIPVVVLFTFAFYVHEAGIQGNLQNELLRVKIFPVVRVISGWFTNFKFKIRGPEAPKNKIVIVEIDTDSLSKFGRWPWHRDLTAYLIQKTLDAGAKVVGLDMVFSEPDQRVPDELVKILEQNGLGPLVPNFETDLFLEKLIHENSERLVLGWMSPSPCQPAYSSAEECPVSDPEMLSVFPKDFEKFAYQNFKAPYGFDQNKTTLLSNAEVIANIEMYNKAAKHSGFFNAWPDDDGYVRRTNLVMTANGKAYPSLALEMLRTGLNEELEIELDQSQKVASIGLARSGRKIPVTPLGVMEINFRGPAMSYQYVRASEVMQDEDQINIEKDRKIASASKMELLKDAYVLIGISAIGVFDMRAFPFDSNTPGVEGHANILDNLLSNDMFKPSVDNNGGKQRMIWMYILMVVGALAFAYTTEKLESVPALLLFVASLSGISFLDLKVLFQNQLNWNTSLLYLELCTIFGFTLAIKYVLEERNKKFIRGAFAKYVAPAVVDSILKDPTKLTVGGEKKELTILFSDIRSFTSFSEKMDAKALAGFLNDYLGIMTDVVFEYGGTLDKYIGDAVMAFWGAPLDQPEHASNACKAAIKMQQLLAQHRDRFKKQYGIDVEIGIGVNSGQVNVGNMGSDRIFEYTVIGDQVNLASRVEGLTKTYASGIVTTRFTLNDIAGVGLPLPAHRVLDFVKVKGKKNAVELVQLLEREYSPVGLRVFEEARQFYVTQKWDEAIEKFNQANELLKTEAGPDGPSVMYIERCKEFKLSPPNADWDGSWEMHSK